MKSCLPLVSMSSLRDLEESLDGQSVLCRGFVNRYVEMWPQRLARIQLAVDGCKWDEATEAALSLFSSSVMVGAARLGQLAGDLVEMLKQHHHEKAIGALDALEHCGYETVSELDRGYVHAIN